MISFKIISDISDVDTSSLPDKEECFDILTALLDMPEIEIAYCVFEDALLVRMCDGGEYVFDFPYFFKGSDPSRVFGEIASYSRRELIPLVFTNVPREELESITDLFPSVTAQAFDDDLDLFVVRVENEISTLSEQPTIELEGITLKKIEERDIDEYAALCMDEEVNRYWGYDYKLDNPDPTLDYFYRVAEAEFHTGVALTLGIYVADSLIGECVAYDFDYFGNCEIGVRLMRSEQSKGYASKALRALFEICRELGLSGVVTRVKSVNAPAVRFVERYMSFVDEASGERTYEYKL